MTKCYHTFTYIGPILYVYTLYLWWKRGEERTDSPPLDMIKCYRVFDCNITGFSAETLLILKMFIIPRTVNQCGRKRMLLGVLEKPHAIHCIVQQCSIRMSIIMLQSTFMKHSHIKTGGIYEATATFKDGIYDQCWWFNCHAMVEQKSVVVLKFRCFQLPRGAKPHKIPR